MRREDGRPPQPTQYLLPDEASQRHSLSHDSHQAVPPGPTAKHRTFPAESQAAHAQDRMPWQLRPRAPRTREKVEDCIVVPPGGDERCLSYQSEQRERCISGEDGRVRRGARESNAKSAQGNFSSILRAERPPASFASFTDARSSLTGGGRTVNEEACRISRDDESGILRRRMTTRAHPSVTVDESPRRRKRAVEPPGGATVAGPPAKRRALAPRAPAADTKLSGMTRRDDTCQEMPAVARDKRTPPPGRQPRELPDQLAKEISETDDLRKQLSDALQKVAHLTAEKALDVVERRRYHELQMENTDLNNWIRDLLSTVSKSQVELKGMETSLRELKLERDIALNEAQQLRIRAAQHAGEHLHLQQIPEGRNKRPGRTRVLPERGSRTLRSRECRWGRM
ncbi:hypothetical protein NKR23_g9017 [Pleurostoma richardsiae]|uniref:Uncharacterized protein n=1 Tax=Pleurostoma richardsiae TaxID=41990 RepID=A0AA38RGX8_9PEZI|nr:hypothetical protein NKR23_g9017 [Pleurostoma richardsiae]